eukprot:PITA_25313
MLLALSSCQKRIHLFIMNTIHDTSKIPSITILGTKSNSKPLKCEPEACGSPPFMNSEVAVLCKDGKMEEGLNILDVMGKNRIPIEFNMYVDLLQVCTEMKALEDGRLVHNRILLYGLEQSLYLISKLVNMYSVCGSMKDARKLFDKISKRNVLLWNSMIRGYANNGFWEGALGLYYEMPRHGLQADRYTFPCALKACASLGSSALWQGKEIHHCVIRCGLESDVFVGNALVTMYAKCGSVEYARQVFDKMPHKDVVSWNAIIGCYAQNGEKDKALRLLQQMEMESVKPDAVTIVSILPVCVSVVDLQQGKEVHDYIRRAGFLHNHLVGNSLITMYAKCGSINDARNVFDDMSQRDVVSWNAMIAGYFLNERCDEALNLFCEMKLTNVKPNVVTWSTIVAGYAQNGYASEAFEVFQQMLEAGVKSDSVAIASVLQACAHLAALLQGKTIHDFVLRNGLDEELLVVNALITMYTKCGSIGYAHKLFDEMFERDVISWNAIIGGYAMHGYGEDALKLFYRMQQVGMKPDHITFVSLLSACSHAGLVDEGWQYFDRMSQDYHIMPRVKHYACMVDLLGRAGLIDEAQNLINEMPLEPDADVWGALLGACRIHGNIELAEKVAEHLFNLEPENSGYYVLLSNIYAAAGRWADVTKVRIMMKHRRLKKTTGCSLIDVNRQINKFLVGDRSHPESDQIYAMLETLSGQMKEAGYVPNTNFVLHDVEEEVKEHMLYCHSEKLAIAFGLIHTSPRTPIRITKNLRVCDDCHSATKLIAKIANREIIVRDANRFHHFKDGMQKYILFPGFLKLKKLCNLQRKNEWDLWLIVGTA